MSDDRDWLNSRLVFAAQQRNSDPVGAQLAEDVIAALAHQAERLAAAAPTGTDAALRAELHRAQAAIEGYRVKLAEAERERDEARVELAGERMITGRLISEHQTEMRALYLRAEAAEAALAETRALVEMLRDSRREVQGYHDDAHAACMTAQRELAEAHAALRYAKPFVTDAGSDEDPEARRWAIKTAELIDAALAAAGTGGREHG